MGKGRITCSFVEQHSNLSSQGFLFALPYFECLIPGDGGGGGGFGVIVLVVVVVVVVMLIESVIGKVINKNSTNLGPSPPTPFLLCVSCAFLFLCLHTCLFEHYPVDTSFLHFSSFISLLCFLPWVTCWKMSGSPEVSGLF